MPGVQLAMDGTTLVVGAPLEGAVFVFDLGSVAGDPCTSADTCFNGFCVDGVCCTVPSCQAASVCNAAETCQPGTGTCSMTPINEGAPCDAGACTSSATCHEGVCTGEVDVCAPADECHEFGTCDPSSGTCFNPTMADGQPCPGGTRQGGVCTPTPTKPVTPPGGCGCGVSSSPPGAALLAALALLLVARRRPRTGRGRRRKRGSGPSRRSSS